VDASPHPYQHEKSGALLLFCKWLNMLSNSAAGSQQNAPQQDVSLTPSGYTGPARLRRWEAAAFLSQRYFPCARQTLAKYATAGGGPIVQYHGRFPLYRVDDLAIWAEARLSAPVRSTSELRVFAGRTPRRPTRVAEQRAGSESGAGKDVQAVSNRPEDAARAVTAHANGVGFDTAAEAAPDCTPCPMADSIEQAEPAGLPPDSDASLPPPPGDRRNTTQSPQREFAAPARNCASARRRRKDDPSRSQQGGRQAGGQSIEPAVAAADLAVEVPDGGHERGDACGGSFHGPGQHCDGRPAQSGERIDSIETAVMAHETLGDGCLTEVNCFGGQDDLPRAGPPPGAEPAAGFQQSRKIAPGMLAPAAGEAVAPGPQVASDARPVAQSGKSRIGGFELAPVSAGCWRHCRHAPAAAFGSGQRTAAAKAVELLQVDGMGGAAPGFGSCGRPSCHLAQTSGGAFENTLSCIVPRCRSSGTHGGFRLSNRRR
jgi:hypothetical protein